MSNINVQTRGLWNYWFFKHQFCSPWVKQQLMELNVEVLKYQCFIMMLNN